MAVPPCCTVTELGLNDKLKSCCCDCPTTSVNEGESLIVIPDAVAVTINEYVPGGVADVVLMPKETLAAVVGFCE